MAASVLQPGRRLERGVADGAGATEGAVWLPPELGAQGYVVSPSFTVMSFGLEPERIRGDDGDEGPRPAADILGAADGLDASVGVDLAGRLAFPASRRPAQI